MGVSPCPAPTAFCLLFRAGYPNFSYADRQFCSSAADPISAFCLTISFYLTYKIFSDNYPPVRTVSLYLNVFVY